MVQAASDGTIVPFSSTLPACASNCGPLFDVQGKCVPPVTKTVDIKCFCSDTRLKPLKSGISGVSTVCGATSCTSETDLETIRKWYTTFCVNTGISSENGDGDTAPASDGNISTHQSSWYVKASQNFWLQTYQNTYSDRMAGHVRWVVMLIIIFALITGSWIAACIYRRRYLRRKEKQTQMIDPIAWGPHQMQGATGGYSQSLSTNERSRPTSKVLNNVILNSSETPTGSGATTKKT
ncbi:putative integral membrane protein [Erysiphe neolycopersici]|uniref:Putative integral membrane protein n=1 Tax=Erysiphe neolycopersici TaxID=212602 RepID=A0A420HT31_9PEZI|nr:putative integral membrane protein [Erysiphe neolycopersici]